MDSIKGTKKGAAHFNSFFAIIVLNLVLFLNALAFSHFFAD